ncbi:histidine kinase [Duganella sp.]|uniref:histidine kinase n=1 Tax=Duganella sp. TaxID=1904440 RepID=UPI0031D43C1F
MNTTPFYLKSAAVEHDPRLVWRYRWQSLLRMWALVAIIGVIVAAVLIAFLLSLPNRGALRAGGWTWLNIFFGVVWPALVPFIIGNNLATLRLKELSEAGTPLTEEMMSARPGRVLISPLDPLTTYNVCTETLSGLAVGMALGYGGPAVFRYSPFEGKILIGPRRPVWLTQCTEVVVGGEPGQPVEVRIRRRFGMDFFTVQRGGALQAVATVAAHLHAQFEQKDRALRAIKREQELERAALNAKLSALQAQVEPHFLFNTLANLKYLIRTDADSAQQMLDHLVGYLQNALPDMRSVSSTLERELALVRDYLSIMQIRMGQRLRFRIQADDVALAQPFPPAMLISLVENAVKHGLERASRAGEIVISAVLHGDALRVQVCDDGVGLTEQMGQGFGLSNIHERLQLLYGDRASLSVTAGDPGGVIATLAINKE